MFQGCWAFKLPSEVDSIDRPPFLPGEDARIAGIMF